MMKRKTGIPGAPASKKAKVLDVELMSSSQLVSCLLPEIQADLSCRLGETSEVAGIPWGEERHRPPYWPEDLLAWSRARDPGSEGSQVTEEILRECLNNYIEWRLDLQQEEERHQEVVLQVMMNPLLQEEVFRHLQPSDLKAVALVCRGWNSAVEQPRYWAWAELSLHPANMKEIFPTGRAAERIRNLGRVGLQPGLTRREVVTVLKVQTESRWRSVVYRGTDLSTAPSPLLCQALTAASLLELELCANGLSVSQLEEILGRISEGPQLALRRLKISQTSLESVCPVLLARALVRLQEVEVDARVKMKRQRSLGSYSVEYEGPIIDDGQVTALFQEIERSQTVRLSKLSLTAVNLTALDPAVLSRAVLGLRQVRLERCDFSDEQADTLVRDIATRKPHQLALKTLSIFKTRVIISPPLLKKVQEKINFQIVTDVVVID